MPTNGTNGDVVLQWAGEHNGSLRSENMSTKDDELYSYDLLIAKKFKANGEVTALVRDPEDQSHTTRTHISSACVGAHSAKHITNVFKVPDIDPYSINNANYFAELVNAYRDRVLFRTKGIIVYKTRVLTIGHYYEALYDLYEYGVFAHAYDPAKLPEPYIEPLSMLEQLEETGDYKFLGRLALEGDIHIVHEKERAYRELTGSNG